MRPRRLPPAPVKPVEPPKVDVQFTAAVMAFVAPDIIYFRDDAGKEHRVRLTPDGLRYWRAATRR